jgi:sulfonate transport system substrate-binding protein
MKTKLFRSRNTLLVIAGAALVAVVASGCSSSSTKSKSSPVAAISSVAALPSVVPANTTLEVADQGQALKTLFSASGVEATLPFKIKWDELNGQPLVLQALRAGADVASASEVGAVFAQAQGVPVKVIGAVKTSTSYPYVFATSHSDINSVSQLKGKKIAYVPGTSYALYTLRVLKAAGLTLKDVTLVNLDFTTLPNAIRTGLVDGGALVQPQAASFLSLYASAGLHELTEGHGLTTGLASTIYATDKALADPATGAALTQFIAAYIKAEKWENDNQAAWENAFYVGINKLTLTVAQTILGLQGKSTVPTLKSLVPAYQGYIDELVAGGELKTSLQATDLIDTRFDAVEQAAASGS